MKISEACHFSRSERLTHTRKCWHQKVELFSTWFDHCWETTPQMFSNDKQESLGIPFVNFNGENAHDKAWWNPAFCLCLGLHFSVANQFLPEASTSCRPVFVQWFDVAFVNILLVDATTAFHQLSECNGQADWKQQCLDSPWFLSFCLNKWRETWYHGVPKNVIFHYKPIILGVCTMYPHWWKPPNGWVLTLAICLLFPWSKMIKCVKPPRISVICSSFI